MNKITRFIVNNPNQEISSSYNCSLGEDKAKKYAEFNAKRNKGVIVAQKADGSESVIADFREKQKDSV